MQSATCFPSVGSTQPSWSPDMTNVAAASPKKPSASGPAIGRSVMRVRETSSSRAAFSRRRLGHPTTSACGAPVLILVVNHFACASVSDWQSVASDKQLLVARRLGGLRGHHPGDRGLLRAEVERPQILEQIVAAVSERGRPGGLALVPLRERLELLRRACRR